MGNVSFFGAGWSWIIWLLIIGLFIWIFFGGFNRCGCGPYYGPNYGGYYY